MMPSPAELKYFLETATTLNVSRAAERLGISQPTLSLALKRLEDNLGARLLIRLKTGVKLTQAGLKFSVQARALLLDWERLRNEALRDESELRGRYVLGCHASVALYCLPGFLPGLLHKNPALELHLRHELSRRITEHVISYEIDFGIVVNPVPHPDLVTRLICKDEVSFWTAVETGGACSDVLICDPDLTQAQSLLKQSAKSKFNFDRMITSSSLEVIAELTAAGAGVGILPARVATRLRGGRLKLLPGAPKFQDRICLIYRADAQKSQASRELARAIERDLLKTL